MNKIELERYTYIEKKVIKNAIKNIKNKTSDEDNCIVESLANSLPKECFRKQNTTKKLQILPDLLLKLRFCDIYMYEC